MPIRGGVGHDDSRVVVSKHRSTSQIARKILWRETLACVQLVRRLRAFVPFRHSRFRNRLPIPPSGVGSNRAQLHGVRSRQRLMARIPASGYRVPAAMPGGSSASISRSSSGAAEYPRPPHSPRDAHDASNPESRRCRHPSRVPMRAPAAPACSVCVPPLASGVRQSQDSSESSPAGTEGCCDASRLAQNPQWP